jgi:ABC-type protease/lipase transport system fused ATPase/permease subunit
MRGERTEIRAGQTLESSTLWPAGAEVRMLHLDVSRAALLTGLWTPLLIALITVAASVVIAVMNSRVDDLKRAERLSQVLAQMEPTPERDVVATVRDDFAVSWSLRTAAPVAHRLRRVSTVMTAAGGVALFGAIMIGVYVGLGYGTVSDWFFWVYYSVGLLLLVAARLLRAVAVRRGRTWIRAERVRRGLREPLHDDLRREAKATTRKAG